MEEQVRLAIVLHKCRAEDISAAIEWIEPADLAETYVSGITTLGPGDIISVGAPGAAGFTREPPLFLERGERVDIEISGLGVPQILVVGSSSQPRKRWRADNQVEHGL